MITGSIVAIVTPMLEDGSLDLPRFRSLIDFIKGRHRRRSSSSAPPASRRR